MPITLLTGAAFFLPSRAKDLSATPGRIMQVVNIIPRTFCFQGRTHLIAKRETVCAQADLGFMFCLLCILVRLWVNDQLDAQLPYIIRLLLQSSTCAGREGTGSFSTCTPDGHLHRILYQMLY